MIRVLLSERIKKTADKLSPGVREKAAQAIAKVAAAFGDPHRHRGLGLRKLARRSYEIRVHLQWRVVFIHDKNVLIAYDVMNHDEISLWLRGQRK
jgi:mRNA-degrading endonuclease RelE of RelBE toxin-antitoxin system